MPRYFADSDLLWHLAKVLVESDPHPLLNSDDVVINDKIPAPSAPRKRRAIEGPRLPWMSPFRVAARDSIGIMDTIILPTLDAPPSDTADLEADPTSLQFIL